MDEYHTGRRSWITTERRRRNVDQNAHLGERSARKVHSRTQQITTSNLLKNVYWNKQGVLIWLAFTVGKDGLFSVETRSTCSWLYTSISLTLIWSIKVAAARMDGGVCIITTTSYASIDVTLVTCPVDVQYIVHRREVGFPMATYIQVGTMWCHKIETTVVE